VVVDSFLSDVIYEEGFRNTAYISTNCSP